MKDLIERNYKSIVKRGLINNNTTETEFVMKLQEEVQEFIEALYYGTTQESSEELADVILVCLNFAKHYDINIESELINKIKTNETR